MIRYLLNQAKIFILMILVNLFFSCNSTGNMNKNLQGLWNVHEASRNGKKTYTLEGTYLKFSNGKILETNIYGDSKTSRYEIEKNIVYPDSFFEEIIVDKVWNDTLLMHFNINNNIFILKLTNKPADDKKNTR